MLGIVFVVGGVIATSWGITTALRGSRPRSLGGALVGAAGLLAAMLGAAALVAPGFLSSM